MLSYLSLLWDNYWDGGDMSIAESWLLQCTGYYFCFYSGFSKTLILVLFLDLVGVILSKQDV